ncbi:MAG TPA: cadherin-like domain-containing protein, partial [Usitatibacter sp.]|nr:cadherin-like domain-containing protein [Usitatibacter sp.]
GPVDSSPGVGGFPSWFQDKTGITMEFCSLLNASELQNGWCTLIPPGPVFPETFPDPFFIEHFYHDAVSVVKDANTGSRGRLIVAVEASFANGLIVRPGDQMTFGRIRVFLTNVPFSGTYTVYHPYGKWTFNNVAAGDRIFFTDDVGLGCVGTFTCTLGTDIGPFLLPSPVAGGAEVPPIPDILPGQDPWYDILVNTGAAKPYPGTGKKYVADPGRLGPVTGSPLPPFLGNDGVTYNHNIFRVEGPNGWTMSSDTFSVTGRILNGALPENVKVDRASYAQPVAGSPTGIKLDVMATGVPTVNARLPAQPQPASTMPIIAAYDAPCAGTIDPVTGVVSPPFSAPVGATLYQLVNTDVKFWAQMHPATVPLSVCVVDQTSVNAAGQIVPSYYNVPVTDEVAITTVQGSSGAVYTPQNGGSLTITANSSDTALPATLEAAGFGPLVNGTLTITPLAAPPATVTVNSSEGGTASLIVTTGVGVAGGGTPPSAVNDTYTMFEDCTNVPATTCATPLVMSPLANDTVGGQPIPAGALITIVTPPRLGTAVLNPDNTITYTPNSNVNGIDGLTYTVTYLGAVSNQASVNITITPVNDIPTAVNDNPGAVVARLNSFNVLANDTDPDGAADLANAQIVTWPAQLGPQPVPTNGVVNFTPTSTGTFSFTYNAVDFSGAVSLAPATVSVVVAGSEAITIAKAIYKVGNAGGGISARWTVQGADSVKEGQTLTIVYNNGTLNAANGGGSCNGTATNPKCVVGTAVVDTLGNYLYDLVLPPGGPSDPTDLLTWATKP